MATVKVGKSSARSTAREQMRTYIEANRTEGMTTGEWLQDELEKALLKDIKELLSNLFPAMVEIIAELDAEGNA